MNVLEKYRLPMMQAPDVAATPAGDGNPSPPPGDGPGDGGSPQLPPAVLNELTRLRAVNREKEAALAQANREVAEARELLDRAANARANGGASAPSAAPQPTPQAPRPLPAAADADIDQRVAAELFRRDFNDTVGNGIKQFGQGYNETVKALDAIGADLNFVNQVMAVDKSRAHVLLKKLADDPAGTVVLLSMDPNRRMVELTRMSMTAAEPPKVPGNGAATPANGATPPAPAPKLSQVSRAPAPPPPIEPSAARQVDWRSDEASDEQFTEGLNERLKTKFGRGLR